jgi:hypothetical protein
MVPYNIFQEFHIFVRSHFHYNLVKNNMLSTGYPHVYEIFCFFFELLEFAKKNNFWI